MDRTIAIVNDLLGMTQGPVGTASAVTVIGRCNGSPAEQGVHHRIVPNGSGKAAVADGFVPPRPSALRQPQLELDIRIAGGLDGAGDAAERHLDGFHSVAGRS